jgi:short-subunit dehydrogenase
MSTLTTSLAIVTGGTAGIGHAFATQMARRGHPLLLIARNEARLAEVAAELGRMYGVRVRVVVADLSRDADIDRIATLLASEPDVGVLVNNAGFGTTGRLHTSDASVQAAMVKLHALAPMQLTRAVLPAMVAAGRGWIINVSSIAGFTFSPGNVNYSSTKAYITRFSQALDTEVAGTGVVVQALCPGFTHTEFHARARMDMHRLPSWAWMTADQVVAASIRAAERGRPVVVIPGVRYRIITALVRLLPNSVMRWGSRVLKRDV